MTERCSTCRSDIPPVTVIRYCFDCQKPLDRHSKWRYKKIIIFGWDREGKMVVNKSGRIAVVQVHRHCNNTDDYVTPEERKKINEGRYA